MVLMLKKVVSFWFGGVNCDGGGGICLFMGVFGLCVIILLLLVVFFLNGLIGFGKLFLLLFELEMMLLLIF